MIYGTEFVLVFFFFKQKTAYEMRISDWSSDVCSSDLLTTNAMRLSDHASMLAAAGVRRINVSLDTLDPQAFRHITRVGDLSVALRGIEAARGAGQIGRASGRERVCQYG